jgi:hypothetical protein
MRSHSRGAMRPRFASTHPPSKREGAGKAGCRLHPRSCARKAHEWTTGSTGSLRLSLREWFTAYFALSPVTGLFATVALRIDDPSRTRWAGCISARLDASIGASGPHDFAVRDRLTPKILPDLVPPASSGKDGLQRRSSARRPIVHGKTRPAIHCAPDAVASIASHRAFVTSRDPPLIRVGRGELVMVICPTC